MVIVEMYPTSLKMATTNWKSFRQICYMLRDIYKFGLLIISWRGKTKYIKIQNYTDLRY